MALMSASLDPADLARASSSGINSEGTACGVVMKNSRTQLACLIQPAPGVYACGRARCRQRALLLESHDSQKAMRKLHLAAGLLGILVFVLSGQAMRLHKPPVRSLADGQRMMFLSRHIYILGSALVNLTLGLYLRLENRGWQRNLQVAGSLLILLSLVLLTLAFVDEQERELRGARCNPPSAGSRCFSAG